ncbi:MAG: mannose-6-phosphate isomerase, class I, partial [Myxococcota bacterium]
EGFAREEAAGVPRDAPTRCYRDPRAKPELLVALDRFDALVGFRGPEAIAATLASGGLLEELGALLPSGGDVETTVRAYFALAPEPRARALTRGLARAATLATEDARWLAAAHEAQGAPAQPDPGLAFVLWLRRVQLRPGEGLFLPAGVPHAYLRGLGIEVMASSDNVLRAGLTPKHVDVAELLRVVRFDAPAPAVLPAPPAGQAYATPAPEFALVPSAEGLSRVAAGPETVLLLGPPGAGATLEVAGETLSLARGDAALLPHGTRYRARAPGGALWLVRPGPS